MSKIFWWLIESVYVGTNWEKFGIINSTWTIIKKNNNNNKIDNSMMISKSFEDNKILPKMTDLFFKWNVYMFPQSW